MHNDIQGQDFVEKLLCGWRELRDRKVSNFRNFSWKKGERFNSLQVVTDIREPWRIFIILPTIFGTGGALRAVFQIRNFKVFKICFGVYA